MDSESKHDTFDEDDAILAEINEELKEIDKEFHSLAAIPRKIDASKLNTKDLSTFLEQRGLKHTGFWKDDVSRLQHALDAEHAKVAGEMELKKSKITKKRDDAIQIAKTRQRKLQEEQEEKLSFARNEKIQFWFKLLEHENPATPDELIVTIDGPVARVLGRHLRIDTHLVCLDLSNSDIGDYSGAKFLSGLEENATLRKLELENTNLGPLSLASIGKALIKNTTLNYICLENNPLTSCESDYSGLHQLVKGLHENQTLWYLNLWKTGLGYEGGCILADGLGKVSESLVSLVFGCNKIGMKEENLITKHMERNRVAKEDKLKREKRHRAEQRKFEAIQKAEQDKVEKARLEEEWLEQRKLERAEQRRLEKEEKERLRREEEERKVQEEMERQRILEEEKARLEAKRKKKKKKKKK